MLVEGGGGGVAEVGGGGIKVGDRARVVIGLEEETFCGAGAEAFCIEVEAEAEIETVLEELLHLLRLAAEAMPDPGLGGAAMETQDIIHGTDAVENEGAVQAFAEANLRLEGSQL